MRAAFPESATLFRAVVQPYVTEAMTRPSLVPERTVDPMVLCIARLTAQKRLDRLIRAFAHVRTPGARLLILGEGEDREQLAGLVTGLGLGERVELPGYAPDVALTLRQASLFVLTSDYEGLPAAVLEAMAANCPVLSTDCFPSARSLVGSAPGGRIIEDCSPHALGAQIDRMLEDPRSDHLSAIAARYSVENGVADHLSALEELLS
jgi:glycosyltransferase involved in cell wall biosynthesis